MRRLKSLLLTISFFGMSIIAFSSNAMGAYQFHFQLPAYMQWTQSGNEQDSSGYTQTYVTQAPEQKVMLNYGAGITTSLRDSMQQVLNNHAQVGCSIDTYQIIKETGNYLTFSTMLNQCPNGQAMYEVIKTYNMSDGQYDIFYSTNPILTPPKMIQQMTKVIESTTVS